MVKAFQFLNEYWSYNLRPDVMPAAADGVAFVQETKKDNDGNTW